MFTHSRGGRIHHGVGILGAILGSCLSQSLTGEFCCFLKQIKVTMNDEDMDTYVFAVGTRKALVRLQKEMQDLVCRIVPTPIYIATVPIDYIEIHLQSIGSLTILK